MADKVEASELTDAEKAAAKAELQEGAEDEFEYPVDSEGKEKIFEVSQEELSIIRAELASSKPYSKDPKIRRPLEYSTEKLSQVLEWRDKNGATTLRDMIDLANGPDTSPQAIEDPERYTKAKAIATALNYSGMYWHGLDKEGRPILWIRCNRLPWYPDVEAQVNALIALADCGINNMPEGVTDFVVLSDSNSPPPPNPPFMINLLKALIRGYPDRLNVLVSAPVGSIIQFIMGLLLPLMPGRLAPKLVLLGVEEGKEKMKEVLLKGEDDIPTFMGGSLDHDKMYPVDTYFSSSRSQGCLKFDFYGMEERLKKSVKEFEESRK